MKIKKFLKRKNYLIRLVFTVAGFCCIPLIILQLIMMEQSSLGYSKMNEESIYEDLDGCTEWFARQIEHMSQTARELCQDTIIRKAAKADCTPYKIYEAHNRIAEFSCDDYIVGVWFNEIDRILYDQLNITSDRLYEKLSGGDIVCEYCRKTVKEFFEGRKYTGIVSTAGCYECENNYIIMAKPVSFFSVVDKDALVFFVMEQQNIEREFQARFHDCSSVALIDKEGDFVVRGHDFSMEICKNEEFQTFLTDRQNTVYMANNGNEYIRIYRDRNDLEEYTCMVSIYEDSQDAYLRGFVEEIRYILIASIIIMIVLLTLTVNINYRPIKSLARKHGSKADSLELSELELLDAALHSSDRKLSSQKQMLTNFLVSDLLRGKKVDTQAIEESELSASVYGYIVLALTGPAISSAQSEKIVTAMRERGCKNCYITSITYQPQMLMVCSLSDEIEENTLKRQVQEVLEDVIGAKYDICCGSVVEKIEDIRTSYLKSLIDLSENNAEKGEFDTDVAEAIRLFGESLENRDVTCIRKRLDTVELCLTKMGMSEDVERYYCYKLMTVYFAKAKKLRNFKKEFASLIEFSDTKQLFAMLHQSVERFCANTSKSEQTVVNKLRQELLTYIDENIYNKELCLISVADYLKTSVYVATRLFKEATGKKFKEYVLETRMEQAKQLLATTNCKIMEVSDQVGFEDVEYFSSQFKARYGQTPTQYRKSVNN